MQSLLYVLLLCIYASGLDVSPVIESEALYHGETGSQAVLALQRSKRAFYTADLQTTLEGEFLPQGIPTYFVITTLLIIYQLGGYALGGNVFTRIVTNSRGFYSIICILARP